MDDLDAAWAAVTAAQRELVRERATFYQHGKGRIEVLRRALQEQGWSRMAAMRLLTDLSEDVPGLVPELVNLAMLPDTCGWARRALRAGTMQHGLGAPIWHHAKGYLPDGDLLDWGMAADLLTEIEAWQPLVELLDLATAHHDPEVRELAAERRQRLAPLRTSGTGAPDPI